jgi:hypothetical protein
MKANLIKIISFLLRGFLVINKILTITFCTYFLYNYDMYTLAFSVPIWLKQWSFVVYINSWLDYIGIIFLVIPATFAIVSLCIPLSMLLNIISGLFSVFTNILSVAISYSKGTLQDYLNAKIFVVYHTVSLESKKTIFIAKFNQALETMPNKTYERLAFIQQELDKNFNTLYLEKLRILPTSEIPIMIEGIINKLDRKYTTLQQAVIQSQKSNPIWEYITLGNVGKALMLGAITFVGYKLYKYFATPTDLIIPQLGLDTVKAATIGNQIVKSEIEASRDTTLLNGEVVQKIEIINNRLNVLALNDQTRTGYRETDFVERQELLGIINENAAILKSAVEDVNGLRDLPGRVTALNKRIDLFQQFLETNGISGNQSLISMKATQQKYQDDSIEFQKESLEITEGLKAQVEAVNQKVVIIAKDQQTIQRNLNTINDTYSQGISTIGERVNKTGQTLLNDVMPGMGEQITKLSEAHKALSKRIVEVHEHSLLYVNQVETRLFEIINKNQQETLQDVLDISNSVSNLRKPLEEESRDKGKGKVEQVTPTKGYVTITAFKKFVTGIRADNEAMKFRVSSLENDNEDLRADNKALKVDNENMHSQLDEVNATSSSSKYRLDGLASLFELKYVDDVAATKTVTNIDKGLLKETKGENNVEQDLEEIQTSMADLSKRLLDAEASTTGRKMVLGMLGWSPRKEEVD